MNNWTPDRPTKPGKYWLSLPKHVRAELDAMVGYETRPCFVVSLDLDRIESLHINCAIESVAFQDWTAGAQWLPYVEPPDPFAEPSTLAESAEEQQRRAWAKWNSGAMDGGPATTPTAALVEEAEKMAVRALDGTASREEKSALFAILAAALRRAEAEREEARRDAEAYKRQTQEVSAKAIELTKEVCAKLDHAIAERDELRATVTRLNRRAQTAEAGVRDNVEASKAAGKSMGRTLANAAAAMYRRRAEQAEAERDAQHAEVLRLTGERDAARAGWQQEVIKGIARAQTVCDVVDALDEARSLGFGLGCMLTNSREETEWQVEETRTLRREVRELSERLAGMPMPEDDDPAGKHLMSLINRRRELYQRVDELTATRDLLNEENARLQARVATLELLLRGGK